MKKWLLAFMVLTSLGLGSCAIEDCVVGTVRFTNISSNPYDLYLNGNFYTEMPGNSFLEVDLYEGMHSVYVEQVSGYLLFPTTASNSISVFGCDETEWVFP